MNLNINSEGIINADDSIMLLDDTFGGKQAPLEEIVIVKEKLKKAENEKETDVQMKSLI